jgi:hypothetical protein
MCYSFVTLEMIWTNTGDGRAIIRWILNKWVSM